MDPVEPKIFFRFHFLAVSEGATPCNRVLGVLHRVLPAPSLSYSEPTAHAHGGVRGPWGLLYQLESVWDLRKPHLPAFTELQRVLCYELPESCIKGVGEGGLSCMYGRQAKQWSPKDVYILMPRI